LRAIKQLGFAEFSYPTAVHNRYVHSMGAMETATQAFDTIFGGVHGRTPQVDPARILLFERAPKAHSRFRAAARLAALLHDIGHGPLSHTTEFAMPDVSELRLPLAAKGGEVAKGRKATHEDYT